MLPKFVNEVTAVGTMTAVVGVTTAGAADAAASSSNLSDGLEDVTLTTPVAGLTTATAPTTPAPDGCGAICGPARVATTVPQLTAAAATTTECGAICGPASIATTPPAPTPAASTPPPGTPATAMISAASGTTSDPATIPDDSPTTSSDMLAETVDS